MKIHIFVQQYLGLTHKDNGHLVSNYISVYYYIIICYIIYMYLHILLKIIHLVNVY